MSGCVCEGERGSEPAITEVRGNVNNLRRRTIILLHKPPLERCGHRDVDDEPEQSGHVSEEVKPMHGQQIKKMSYKGSHLLSANITAIGLIAWLRKGALLIIFFPFQMREGRGRGERGGPGDGRAILPSSPHTAAATATATTRSHYLPEVNWKGSDFSQLECFISMKVFSENSISPLILSLGVSRLTVVSNWFLEN